MLFHYRQLLAWFARYRTTRRLIWHFVPHPSRTHEGNEPHSALSGVNDIDPLAPFRKTIRAGCSRTHMPNDEPNYSTATVTRKYLAVITVVSLLELLF
jgi:hypothetical protein